MRLVRCVILGLVLGGCAPSISSIVLARVNDETVTVGVLAESFDSSHKGHGVLLAGSGAVREFLNKVIDKRLLVQEAHRIGLQEDSEIREMTEALRAKRAAEGLYAAEVTRKVGATDGEVEAAYERLGDRLNGRHILVRTREDAERALARLRNGEEFGEVARQVSRAETAGRGGDLGIVQWGRLDPEMEEVLWKLEKGEVSEPFETEEGWNLLYLVARTSVAPPPLARARRDLETTLNRRETRERSRELLRRLMERPGGRIDEEPVLRAIAAPPGGGPSGTTVVAEAAGQPISLEQALKGINLEAAKKIAPDRLRLEIRSILRGEVFKRLLQTEGLARGYGEAPEVVQEIEKVTDDAILSHLINKVILGKVEVQPEDVDAYYREHPAAFTEPEAIKVSAILVEKEEEAGEIVAALKAGKDFRSLARTASRDPSLVASGGEIATWITRGQLDPAIEEVAFSLTTNSLGMAEGKAGYWIVRLDDRRPERLKPLEEVRAQAREAARRQRSRDEVATWVKKLREASTVEIDDAAIGRAIAAYEEEARNKSAKRMPHR